jgi:EAL domain-containing protein (putative c-di-GMP-specific phosphodiesterase class I)
LISDLGVDFAQGHLIGKPISLDSVLSDLSGIK